MPEANEPTEEYHSGVPDRIAAVTLTGPGHGAAGVGSEYPPGSGQREIPRVPFPWARTVAPRGPGRRTWIREEAELPTGPPPPQPWLISAPVSHWDHPPDEVAREPLIW